MNTANVEMLESASATLAELPDELVFVGGATVELWATDQAIPEFRPTEDVDAIVEITTLAAYYGFEERLRGAGFVNVEEEGVIGRFRHRESGFRLDVMPTEASILGFENRWQKMAFPHAEEVALPSGRSIRAIPPTYLMATKLEAFRSRGKGDLLASKDFEDVIVLIDSREELVAEMASADKELRTFVSERLAELLEIELFDSAAEGALRGGPETLERYEEVVRPRIEAIVGAQAQPMRPDPSRHPSLDERFDPAVRIVDYDPRWPEMAGEEIGRVEGALGDVAVRVEHVGSTAVPGLAAKPIVDLLVAVAEIEPRARYVEPLKRLGYLFAPDPESPDFHFFGLPAERPRTHHLHVCVAGAEDEVRHLALRDYLRARPDEVAGYAALKREVAARDPQDRLAYIEGKADYVAALEGRALAWARAG